MIRLQRRYRFPASHRLYRREWTDARNSEVFGKCANPFGHGHDYELEITVKGEVDPVTGRMISLTDLDKLVDAAVLSKLRYRNLNEEIAAFRESVPTTENLAREVDLQLRKAWAEMFPPDSKSPAIEKLRIWETDRNICEITG